MKKTTFVILCAIWATPCFAETAAEATGVNSTLGIAPSTPDFVKQAAIGDMFEIASSQLAEQRSDAATKAFAAKMIADHTNVAQEMKSLAGVAKVEVPTTLDASHQKMLDELKGMQGADFTKQYHKDQYSAHEDAVSLYQRYAKGGDNAELKKFASITLPTLQEHEKMASNLDK